MAYKVKGSAINRANSTTKQASKSSTGIEKQQNL